jgi:hypothetical protein
MKNLVVVLLVFTLTMWASACGDDSTGPALEECTSETTTVSVTVTTGQSVVFDWEPACPLAMLLVEDDASDVWGISTDMESWVSPSDANRITPPVTYGVTPSGVTEFEEPLTLAHNARYDLILWRVLPEGSTAQCQSSFGNACMLTNHQFTR